MNTGMRDELYDLRKRIEEIEYRLKHISEKQEENNEDILKLNDLLTKSQVKRGLYKADIDNGYRNYERIDKDRDI